MSDEKIIQLGGILNDEQIDHITAILSSKDDDFLAKCNTIKKYLVSFRKELEAKGVSPEYLAYVIVYQIHGQSNGKGNTAEPWKN